MAEATTAPVIAQWSLAGRAGLSRPVLFVAVLSLATIPVAMLVENARHGYSSVSFRVASGVDSLLPVYVAFGVGSLARRLGWFTVGVALLLAVVAAMGYALHGSWRFLGWSLEPCIVWFFAFPLVISWLFIPVRLLTGPITGSLEGGGWFQFRMFDLLVITAVAAVALSLARRLGVDLLSWQALRDLLLCTGYTLLPVFFAAGSRRWHFVLGVAVFLPALALSVYVNRGVVNQELIVHNAAFLLVVYLPLLALRWAGYRFRATTPQRRGKREVVAVRAP